jgi:uncharacterized protein involved in tellurium resistance
VRARVELANGVLNVGKGKFAKLNYAEQRKYHWGNKWNAAEKVMRDRKEKTLSC